MLTVNDRRYAILAPFDTRETLKARVAASFNTIPEFLGLWDNEASLYGSYRIEPAFWMEPSRVEDPDLWTTTPKGERGSAGRIRTSGLADLSKIQFDRDLLKKIYVVANMQTQAENVNGELTEKDYRVFAVYSMIEGASRRDLEALFEKASVAEMEAEIDNIWMNKLDIIRAFRELVARNARVSADAEQSYLTILNAPIEFTSSRPVIERVRKEVIVPVSKNMTMPMIFDSVQTESRIAACCYFEVAKEFNPCIKYNPAYKSLVNAYLQARSGASPARFMRQDGDMVSVVMMENATSYSVIDIYIQKRSTGGHLEEATSSADIVYSLESAFRELDAGESEILDKLINWLGKVSGEFAVREIPRTRRVFYTASYNVSTHVPILVLKDIITNDRAVSSVVYLNESTVINTRKNSLNLFLKTDGKIKLSLFEKENGGMFIQMKQIPGERTDALIDATQNTVNRILAYALINTPDIISFYTYYFKPSELTDVKPFAAAAGKPMSLKKLKPAIFLPNYTRLCANPPELVERPDDTTLTYPLEETHGESPSFYKCKDPRFSVPGLRTNSLENAHLFPTVPCCYKRTQRNKPNYASYFNQEHAQVRINSGEIGKTLKLLSPNRIGELPPDTKLLLESVTFTSFLRMGGIEGPDACLHILNKVTNLRTPVEAVREQLAARFAHLCQFGTQADSGSEAVRDPSTYIDPVRCKRALEEYYDVSIILFNIESDDFAPVSDFCSLKRRVVLLMEHIKRNHVELLISLETSFSINKKYKTPQLYFDKANPGIAKIYKLLQQRFEMKRFKSSFSTLTSEDDAGLRNSIYPWEVRAGNNKIVQSAAPICQYIDHFGKTRMVEFRSPNYNNFVALFDPLPCLIIPSKPSSHFARVNDALSTDERARLRNTFEWLRLPDVSRSSDTSLEFSRFARARELADYLFWAARHLFAKSNMRLREWIDTRTVVRDTFDYANVSISPLLETAALTEGEKFVFNSAEFRRRVEYNLSLISPDQLSVYESAVYGLYYANANNFRLEQPTQLALSVFEYARQTNPIRDLYKLDLKNLKYMEYNTYYYILADQDVLNRQIVVFFPSLSELLEEHSRSDELQPLRTGGKVFVVTPPSLGGLENTPVVYTLEENINIVLLKVGTAPYYGLIKNFDN